MSQNDTLALLAGYDLSQTTPDDGKREAKLPDNGIHTVEVIDVIVESSAKTTFGSKANNVPGVNIAFVYRYLPDASSSEDPYVFYGERFRLPAPGQRAAALALDKGKYVKTLEITEGRLANHIRIILGRPASASIGDDILAIGKKVKESKVTVRVKTRSYTSKRVNPETGEEKEYSNFVEHLQELLSA